MVQLAKEFEQEQLEEEQEEMLDMMSVMTANLMCVVFTLCLSLTASAYRSNLVKPPSPPPPPPRLSGGWMKC